MRYLQLMSSILFLLTLGCKEEKTTSPSPSPTTLQKIWFEGKAELTSYTLEQARYGEIRSGEAVIIFVTEDFSNDKLVKLDDPEKAKDKTKVLKMNLTKNFVTGIYPYSMMLSVFTPVADKEKTMKITSSVQEWCGQTYASLRLKGDNYDWWLDSYFEKEGSQQKQVGGELSEDGLWTTLRINPAKLPLGKIKLLPSVLWQRLSHTEMQAEDAEATLAKADSNFIKESAQVYTITYPSLKRTLQIYFAPDAPYEILGWQESYPDGFGENKRILTTKAVRKKTMWLDYWKHNKNVDSTRRDSLQLSKHGY